MAGIYFIPFKTGASLQFSFSGQSIPNRVDVSAAKGIKIYFDAVETAARVAINKALIQKVFHEAAATTGVLSKFEPEAVEQLVYHVAAHEVGHAVTPVTPVTSVTSPQVGREPQAIWTGPEFPNSTTAKLPPAEAVFDDCGFEEGCLFELRSYPSEHLNLASSHPEVVSQLRARLATSNATVFAPHRPRSPRACEASLQKYKDPRYSFGWWGPFADDA